MDKKTERIYNMTFARVYPLYIEKVKKKGRTTQEVNEVISWLTGYTTLDLEKTITDELSFEDFFKQAPILHPNAHKITGLICGIRVEDIEDPVVQNVRYMDKLIDELAKGRPMEKILRP